MVKEAQEEWNIIEIDLRIEKIFNVVIKSLNGMLSKDKKYDFISGDGGMSPDLSGNRSNIQRGAYSAQILDKDGNIPDNKNTFSDRKVAKIIKYLFNTSRKKGLTRKKCYGVTLLIVKTTEFLDSPVKWNSYRKDIMQVKTRQSIGPEIIFSKELLFGSEGFIPTSAEFKELEIKMFETLKKVLIK